MCVVQDEATRDQNGIHRHSDVRTVLVPSEPALLPARARLSAYVLLGAEAGPYRPPLGPVRRPDSRLCQLLRQPNSLRFDFLFYNLD